MRKTKIICTLGPSTDQEGVLRELVANGMNVARFNFSHGSHEEHLGRFEKLKAIREELGLPVAALLDTKGPEIRLRDFKNGTEMLEAGQTFTLTTREVEGTKEICSITYKDLPQDVQPGGTIMLDDGLIKLQIVTVNDTDIVCKVLNTGKISVSDATAHAACLTAKDVNAAAIVTVSESGNTARLLSKYRPDQPIIACVMKEQVQRQLALSWGITPLMMPLAHSTDELIERSTSLAKENGYLHNGELAVVTAGVPVGVSGTTNMIKIHMVGNCLATGVGVGPENADVTNATGKACVCRTLEEVRAKFKPGMVLVVPSTTNEMLSFVRDAAALVVEEPGLNSHAAIAGKALLKPTVVGAAGATSHIRDGLMVAVDCAHGSVQCLQA